MSSPPRQTPPRPPATTTDLSGTSYMTFYAEDGRTIEAIYLSRPRTPHKWEYLPKRPLRKWWQFWRWFEIDLYGRW